MAGMAVGMGLGWNSWMMGVILEHMKRLFNDVQKLFLKEPESISPPKPRPLEETDMTLFDAKPLTTNVPKTPASLSAMSAAAAVTTTPSVSVTSEIDQIRSQENYDSTQTALQFHQLLNAYQSNKFPPGEEPLVLFHVQVLKDGWGDLFNALNAVKVYRTRYPQAPVALVVMNSHDTSIDDLKINLGEYSLTKEQIFQFQHSDGLIPSFYDGQNIYQPESNLSTPALKLNNYIKHVRLNRKQQKLVHISIAVPPPTFLDPRLDFESTILNEYDGPRRMDATTREIFAHSMGVTPVSLGIFVPEISLPSSFNNQQLNQLFNSEKPVFLNYGWNLSDYINVIRAAHPDLKTIDIVTNLQSNTPIPKISGITIQLHNPFPLSHGDVLLAMNRSAQPVGVTGNVTFSELLSMGGQLPFYNNRHALKAFWDGVQEHANVLGLTELANYFDSMPVDNRETYSMDMHAEPPLPKTATGFQIGPENIGLLIAQWDTLRNHLIEHCKIDNNLMGLIHRASVVTGKNFKETEETAKMQIKQGDLTGAQETLKSLFKI